MEIFLANTELLKLDVEPIDAPFSYSVADMKNPDKRKASVSKTIKIKGTANNMRVLQVFYNLSASELETGQLAFAFDPRQRIEARVDDNGITVFDGLLQIVKATITNRVYEFEGILFSDMANIYNKLGNLTIADLGWSEYNHVLGQQVIRDCWDTSVIVNGTPTNNFTGGVPDGFGYIYSWFDLGYTYPSNTPRFQRTNQMIPGVYFREVLQKIFGYLDLDYNFTLNDTEKFKRLVLFNKLGEQLSLSAQEIADREFESDMDWNVNQIVPNITQTQYSLFTNYIASLQTVITEQNNTSLGNNSVAINSNGTYNIVLSGDLELKFQALNPSDFTDTIFKNGEVIIRKNGTIVGQQAFLFPDITALGTSATIENININQEIFLQAGDTIDLSIDVEIGVISNVPNAANPEIDIQANSLNLSLEAQDVPLEDGDTVQLARFVADMKCSDFLRSLLRLFNLYQVPEDDGSVTLIPAKDYYGSTAAADVEDWTEKLDHSEVIEIEPPNRIEGKFYNFKWVDEDDLYHEQYIRETGERYGNNLYEIQNTWQVGINDIEVGFSQSVPVQIQGSEQIMPTIIQEQGGNIEPYKGKAPRVFFYNGLVQVPDNINNVGAIYTSSAAIFDPLFIGASGNSFYPQFHHTLKLATDADFDLNWELPQLRYYDGNLSAGTPTNNLFEEYWRQFIEELTSADAKILTAFFKLSKLDIKELDFSPLKMINGVLYRLNLVDNYVSTQNISTRCELIKVLKGRSRRRLVIVDGTPPFNPGDATFMTLVNQTGTSDPTVEEFYRNDIGVTLNRRDVGQYDLNTTRTQFENTTIFIHKQGRGTLDYEIEKLTATSYRIKTYDTSGNLADGLLNAIIEIKRR